MKKPKLFTSLFIVGIMNGLILSNLSDVGLMFFVEHSLAPGILVLVGFLVVLLSSWSMSSLIQEMNTTTKIRHIVLGISIASLCNLMVKLAIFARKGVMGGVIEVHAGSPYVEIMGVSFATIIWSLFLASLFATIERLIKVWEET